jgi:D-alanyl-D-alanine carboxypeptidase
MKNAQLAMRMGTSVAVVAGCLSGAACSASTSALTPSSAPAPVSSSAAAPASPSTPPTPSAEPTTASPSPTGPPKFSAKVSRVTRKQLPYSWRPGCPVPVQDLRLITMSYWGFDDKPHTGELVVNKDGTDAIVNVFGRLYGWRWPIYKMQPVDAYKGSDFDSIEADNTSAFNCRPATGSSSWSQHAYGRAVDINPRENPYVSADGSLAHKNARKFGTRPLDAPGVINPGDRVVKAFAKVGWGWGGIWSGAKDFQHFSESGG